MKFTFRLRDLIDEILDDLLKSASALNIEIEDVFKDVIPVMTSNTSPSGIASASSVFSSAYQAWRAFDGNDLSGDSSRWISQPGKLPAWLSYEFPSQKRITRYFILPELAPSTRNHAPKNWTFEGWNGSSWVVLDTRTNITLDNYWIPNIDGMYFEVKNPGYYKKYRINITALNGSDAVSIRQLKMFEDSIITNSNLLPIEKSEKRVPPELRLRTDIIP